MVWKIRRLAERPIDFVNHVHGLIGKSSLGIYSQKFNYGFTVRFFLASRFDGSAQYISTRTTIRMRFSTISIGK